MDCGSSKALGKEVWSQTTGHICQTLKKIEMQDQSRSTLQILTFVTYFYFWCTSFWRHFSLFSFFFLKKKKQDNLIFQYTHLPPSKETQLQYYRNIEYFNKNRLKEPTYGKQIIKTYQAAVPGNVVVKCSNIKVLVVFPTKYKWNNNSLYCLTFKWRKSIPVVLESATT